MYSIKLVINRNDSNFIVLLADLRESQSCPAARVLELEARLTVGERSVIPFPASLQFADLISALLLRSQRREVIRQSLDDLLKDLEWTFP